MQKTLTTDATIDYLHAQAKTSGKAGNQLAKRGYLYLWSLAIHLKGDEPFNVIISRVWDPAE